MDTLNTHYARGTVGSSSDSGQQIIHSGQTMESWAEHFGVDIDALMERIFAAIFALEAQDSKVILENTTMDTSGVPLDTWGEDERIEDFVETDGGSIALSKRIQEMIAKTI